jgi:hypothetical protein
MTSLLRSLRLLLPLLVALPINGFASATCPECGSPGGALPDPAQALHLGDGASLALEMPAALALARAVNPRTATRRAMLFPGGGHFYTGESGRGAALLGVAAGSVLAGVLLSSSGGTCTPQAPGDGCEYDPDTHEYRSGDANRTPLYLGLAAAAGAWVYGILDASNSAARRNGRSAASGSMPLPLVSLNGEGRAVFGLRVQVGL